MFAIRAHFRNVGLKCGIPAVEGTAQNPEKEDIIDYKQICFIANDKCYELVVYHGKDDAAERIAQKILDGLSF